MNMEAVAELATRAWHLWSTKAGKAARLNHWSRFRCLIRPHAGVTIGSVKGKKRDLQQCTKCPEGASPLPSKWAPVAWQVVECTMLHHVAPPTSMAFGVKSVCQGLMVNQSNISRPYHCPNPLACPGGLLSSNGSTPMCTKGRVKKTWGTRSYSTRQTLSASRFNIPSCCFSKRYLVILNSLNEAWSFAHGHWREGVAQWIPACRLPRYWL